jgi:hypothetical protein
MRNGDMRNKRLRSWMTHLNPCRPFQLRYVPQTSFVTFKKAGETPNLHGSCAVSNT